MPVTNEHDVCLQCGYSLHTLTHEHSCPECGKSVGQSRKERRMARHYRRNWWPTFRRRVRKTCLYLLTVYLICLAIEEASQSKRTVYEFCPQTLETRIQTWYEFPFLHFRISGDSVVELKKLELATWLESKGIVSPQSSPQMWMRYGSSHRVRYLLGEHSVRVGHSYLKRAIADMKRNARYLILWSENNPEKANYLWPLVQHKLMFDGEGGAYSVSEMLRYIDKSWTQTTSDAEFKEMIDFIAKLPS